MPKASRSFCQLDLASLLDTTASGTWSQSVRKHALDCPCCALRLGAIDRLNARLGTPRKSAVAPAPARARQAEPGRIARLVWGPARRVAAFAAVGLAAAFLALAAGHGVGPGIALLSEPALDDHFPSARLSATARWSEEGARELASNGSPTPLRLMPPAFPLE